MKRKALNLTAAQRRRLEGIVAQRSARAGHVLRVRVVLLSAEGVRGSEIAGRLGIRQEQVSRIRSRFLAGGIDGLADQPKAGRKDHAVSAEVEQRILELAFSPPPPGRSRWTTRLIGRDVG